MRILFLGHSNWETGSGFYKKKITIQINRSQSHVAGCFLFFVLLATSISDEAVDARQDQCLFFLTGMFYYLIFVCRRSRRVWHLQYSDWQEQGLPRNVSSYLQFLEELSELRRLTVRILLENLRAVLRSASLIRIRILLVSLMRIRILLVFFTLMGIRISGSCLSH
jgi:hypothetical protein